MARELIEYGEWLMRLFPPDKEEVKKKGIRLSPRTLTFQLTDACNLCCTYCYQGNKGNHRMPFSVAKTLIDKLLSGEDGITEYLGNPFGIILDFIGGEPFLEVELMDKIVDYFRERTIELDHPWADKHMISVCSNGVLYNDPKVQNFLQKNVGHLSLNVTVDGIKELHDKCRIFKDGTGSYDIAHSAAKNWMDRGYEMGSKITIAPENLPYLDISLRQMIKDGYRDINANFVYEDVWNIDLAKEAYRQSKSFTDWMRNEGINPLDYFFSFFSENMGHPLAEGENQNYCGGAGLMLAVDYKGDLFPCLRYMESSLNNEQKPYIIGNVEKGIAHDACTKDCLNCLNEVTRRSQSTDECFYCPVASMCGWCSAYNYQRYGTVNKRSTAICRMHMAQSLGINYYWNTYYKEHPELNKVLDLWLPRKYALEIISDEEYDMLKDLTLSLGGKVNEDKTKITGYIKEPNK